MRVSVVFVALVACLLDQTAAAVTEDVKTRASAFKKGINKLKIVDVTKFGGYISELNQLKRFERTRQFGLRSLYDLLDDPNLELDIYGNGWVPSVEKRKNIESACEKLVAEGEKVEQDTGFDEQLDREIRKTFKRVFPGLSWSLLKFKLGFFRACRKFLNHLKQAN